MLEEKLRKSGIEILGDVSWGTHFCQFFQTREDLVHILVPYFKAGLENNEFCMWITSHPLSEKEAEEELRKAVPDFDSYDRRGQIEILSHTDWYLREGIFDSARVLNGWIEKLDSALTRGFDGLRLTGNTFWLEKSDWRDFLLYEESINSVIGKYRMIALCTYSLEKCNATEVIDVVNSHQFALARREGMWDRIESAERKLTRQRLVEIAESLKGANEALRTQNEELHAQREVLRIRNGELSRLWELTREAEQDLNRAQSVAHTGSWRLNVARNELRWSNETYRIFGLPMGLPLSYETFLAAVHPQDRDYVDRNWSAALLGEPYDIEHRIVVGGRVKWVRERAELEFDQNGAPLGGFGTVQDITRRKKAEEAIHSTALFPEQNPSPVLRVDNRGSLLYANRASDPMLADWRCDVGRPVPETFRQAVADSLADDSPRELEIRISGRDLSLLISPVKEQDYANIYGRDITERKEAEKALRKAHDELETRVAERTAELRAKDQLLIRQGRQAAMGEMINNIAHQWRQPLNSLSLLIQSLPLINATDGLSPEQIDDLVDKALEIISHMSRTIDDFRNFFKPDKEKSFFTAKREISRAVSLIEDSFRTQRIAVEFDVADDPLIFGYPNEYSQVLLNILSNARDAFSERKVSDPRVIITIGTVNGKSVVKIADNAGGIPEDILDNIFAPYFTTKGHDKGTGVGLFMSKAIIEKSMGGSLSAGNKAEGAEFRIEV